MDMGARPQAAAFGPPYSSGIRMPQWRYKENFILFRTVGLPA
jgi:hypothetical protein